MEDALALDHQEHLTALVVWLEQLGEKETALLSRCGRAGVPLLLVVPARLEADLVPLVQNVERLDYRLADGLTETGLRYAVEQLVAAQGQQEELARLKRQLDETQKEYEQFAHLVAHDASAPLRVVVKFAEMLAEHQREHLDERGRGYLKYVVEHATEAKAMIEELRRFSKLRPPEGVTTIDLMDLVDDIRSEWSERLAAAEAELEVGTLPRIRGQLAHFDLLFRVVLDNALIYRRPGVKPVIHLEAEQVEGVCTLTVSDNGLGLDSYMQRLAFELFHRCHPEVGTGHGTGLAFARKVVRMYGGRIWIDSVEQQGSTVYISLPSDLQEAE